MLAEALIHTLGGLDEAGLAALTEAERIAIAQGDLESVARARAELGYVDFLRARYDRAERLLDQVLAADEASPSVRAKAMTYLGSVASDRADYPRATALLEGAIRASRAVGEPRREAFGLSMLGRVGLLRGDLDAADEHLRAAVAVAEREHWLSFLPWPQALLGHVSWPRVTSTGPRPAWSSRSRGPARSATPAGRASRPAGWPCSPRRRGTPTGPSPTFSTPAHAPTGWPTPTYGSTCTSWTLCARWVAAMGTRDRRLGRGDARAGVPCRDAGADRARHVARGAARPVGDAEAAALLAARSTTPGSRRCW